MDQDLHTLIFDDLTPREEAVKIGKDWYLLREASEWAACAYRNEGMKGARFEDGKLRSVDGVANVEPLLVHLCLFFAVGDPPDGTNGSNGTLKVAMEPTRGDPLNVPLKTVRSWPSRIVKPLFDRAKQLSELEEDESEEFIKEQIKVYTEKLEKINETKAKKETALKNGHGSTTDTSVERMTLEDHSMSTSDVLDRRG